MCPLAAGLLSGASCLYCFVCTCTPVPVVCGTRPYFGAAYCNFGDGASVNWVQPGVLHVSNLLNGFAFVASLLVLDALLKV